MPFLGPALPYLAAGVGAVGSGLASRAKTTKSASTSNATVTTPGELQPLQGDILEQLRKRLQDPSAGTAGVRQAGRNRINSSFRGADQALRDKFLSQGGASGKYGAAARGVETARAGALSGFEGDLASLILGREDNTLSLSQRLLQSGQGRSVTGTGEQTAPGNVAGAVTGSIGNSLGTLATLTTLNKLLSGGGGSVGDVAGGGYQHAGVSGILDKILGTTQPSIATPPFVGRY
jgi:hypothetical protein